MDYKTIIEEGKLYILHARQTPCSVSGDWQGLCAM